MSATGADVSDAGGESEGCDFDRVAQKSSYLASAPHAVSWSSLVSTLQSENSDLRATVLRLERELSQCRSDTAFLRSSWEEMEAGWQEERRLDATRHAVDVAQLQNRIHQLEEKKCSEVAGERKCVRISMLSGEASDPVARPLPAAPLCNAAAVVRFQPVAAVLGSAHKGTQTGVQQSTSRGTSPAVPAVSSCGVQCCTPTPVEALSLVRYVNCTVDPCTTTKATAGTQCGHCETTRSTQTASVRVRQVGCNTAMGQELSDCVLRGTESQWHEHKTTRRSLKILQAKLKCLRHVDDTTRTAARMPHMGLLVTSTVPAWVSEVSHRLDAIAATIECSNSRSVADVPTEQQHAHDDDAWPQLVAPRPTKSCVDRATSPLSFQSPVDSEDSYRRMQQFWQRAQQAFKASLANSQDENFRLRAHLHDLRNTHSFAE